MLPNRLPIKIEDKKQIYLPPPRILSVTPVKPDLKVIPKVIGPKPISLKIIPLPKCSNPILPGYSVMAPPPNKVLDRLLAFAKKPPIVPKVPGIGSLHQKEGTDLVPTTRYKDIVALFILKIQVGYRDTYESCIKPICDALEKGSTDRFYKLIYGLMQSGKSLVIAFLLWILHYKYRMYPVFLTKGLDGVRIDIRQKLTEGVVIGFLREITSEMQLDEFELKQFTPRVCDFQDLKRDPIPQLGMMPIFIMHPANYKQLINFIKNVHTKLLHKASTVFIVDEIHEYFTKQERFVNEKGLSLDRIKVNPDALSIIHYLRKMVTDGLSYLIGVTATPEPILADTHLYPKLADFIKFRADPPFPGAEYHGYQGRELVRVAVEEYEREVDVVRQILANRSSSPICPVVLIATERLRGYHWDLFKEIRRISPHIYVRTFFDDKKDLKGIPPAEVKEVKKFNCQTIDEFYGGVTEYIKRKGICVLIGKNRLAASVTVKSSKRDEMLPGLTDEIVSDFSSLPSTMQLVGRLFGWYPPGHKSTLWVPIEDTVTYAKDLINTHEDVIEQYDGHPRSIEHVKGYGKINRITGSKKKDLYANKRRNLQFEKRKSNSPPPASDNVIEFKTTYTAFRSLRFGNDVIGSFHAPRDDKQKQKNQTQLHDEATVFLDCNAKFQIGYDHVREERIYKASVFPDDPSDSNWQVNSFLYGRDSINTKIDDTYIVEFEVKWQDRSIIEPGQTIYYQVSPDEWVIISAPTGGSFNDMSHKYPYFFDGELTDEHYEALSSIDKIWEQIKQGKKTLTGYNLFQKVRKELKQKGGGNGTVCSPLWKKPNVKVKFDELAKSDNNLDFLLEEGKALYQCFFTLESSDHAPSRVSTAPRLVPVIRSAPLIRTTAVTRAAPITKTVSIASAFRASPYLSLFLDRVRCLKICYSIF